MSIQIEEIRMQQSDLIQVEVLNMAFTNTSAGVLSKNLKIENVIIQELFFI